MPKKDIVLLDLFSGAGGFHKGLERAGFNIVKCYFSEIDKHAIANYKYNFPDAEYIGSVTEIDGSEIEHANIITFGFPCQDLSLAGKRLGFKGNRSSLFYHAARVVRENQSDVFIWENVAGLMSSNGGKDIECVFEEMFLSGYVFDVSLINGSWFLPQNRLRLYSVGYNIKYLQKCLIKKSGTNTSFSLFVKIMEGYLLTKYPQYLTEAQSQSEQRQKDLALEFVKTKEENRYRGQNLKKRYSEAIGILPLETLQVLCQEGQLALSRQCDSSAELLTTGNPKDYPETDTKSHTARGLKTEEECISNIETLLRDSSEDHFLQLSRFTILTLTKQTTQKEIFTYAQMQLNIELFIIHLNLLYPNCWNEALLNLTERKKDISYAENRGNQGGIIRQDNNYAIQLSLAEEFGDDAFSHLAGRSRPGVFPFREDDFRPVERSAKTPVVGCLSGGGHSGGMHSGMTLIQDNPPHMRRNARTQPDEPNRPDNRSADGTDDRTTDGREYEHDNERREGQPDTPMIYDCYNHKVQRICNTLSDPKHGATAVILR